MTPLTLQCEGADLLATLTAPVGPCRAAVVLLHPAGDGSRDQVLFEHLAAVLPQLGFAVLRFDRRPRVDGDVPFAVQFADLNVALAATTDALGQVPIGLWGASQGAWIAMLAAAEQPRVDFLVLVGCSAVSPAAQMRYGTSEQARRAGFDHPVIAEIGKLRRTYEGFVRGDIRRKLAQSRIDAVSDHQWFALAVVPAVLPERPTWGDMDFDPAPAIAELDAPVLLTYGVDDWVPVERSIDIWNRNYGGEGEPTIVRLTESGHLPLLDGGVRVDPDYTAALLAWLDGRVLPMVEWTSAKPPPVSKRRVGFDTRPPSSGATQPAGIADG